MKKKRMEYVDPETVMANLMVGLFALAPKEAAYMLSKVVRDAADAKGIPHLQFLGMIEDKIDEYNRREDDDYED